MSSAYVTEPTTKGKIILHTTAGDLELELWPKEAPKACRNFVQLCMEGYYDQTIFHRVVSNFIVQGGDPQGTGLGGESIYGHPFVDEFHSRLRFTRRGLLAMANTGAHSNTSQFFFTLAATPELNNRNTIFGKVVGDTLYNLLKIGEGETDDQERPLYPTKITHTTLLANPFDDIVPRENLSRKRETEAVVEAPKKKPKLKKNVNLLSFEDGEEEEVFIPAKMKSSHDILDNDPTLSKEVDTSIVSSLSTKHDSKPAPSKKVVLAPKPPPSESDSPESDESNNDSDSDEMKSELFQRLESARQKQPSASEQVASLKAQIKQIGNHAQEKESKKTRPKSSKGDSTLSVQDLRAAYLSSGKAQRGIKRKASKRRDVSKSEKTLDQLEQFQAKLRAAATNDTNLSSKKNMDESESRTKDEDWECELHFIKNCESCRDSFGTEDQDDGDDGWMSATLKFAKQTTAANVYEPKVDDYTVIDPRQEKLKAKPDIFGRDIKASGNAYKDRSTRHRNRD